MEILFSNISVITMDERMQVLTDAFVGVTDGKISWLAKKPPEEKPEKIIDGTGMVLMPGLVNCRTHLTQTLLRGCTDDLSVAQGLEKRYAALEQMDERAAKASALLGIAQCLRMGVTSVSDMSTHVDAVAQAVAESGIKANLAPELTLLTDEDFDFEKDPGCCNFVAAHDTWHGYDNGRVLVEAGVQGEYTSCHPLWDALSSYALEERLGMQLSLSRFGWENEDCLDRTGLTPAQLLDCHHMLDGRTTAAHCCHLEQEDMALLGRRKTTAVVCFDADAKQAAGAAQIPELVKAGMNVAFGTGSSAESGNMDLLAQARAAALAAKLKAEDAELLNAASVLLMATVCGAKAQGRSENTGMIKLGFDADMIALDFTQPHLIPSHDLISSAVYAATGHDVCMTMVRGKILYASGKYLTIDLNMLMTELASYALPTVFAKKEEQEA